VCVTTRAEKAANHARPRTRDRGEIKYEYYDARNYW
jgi:hypothetical protein